MHACRRSIAVHYCSQESFTTAQSPQLITIVGIAYVQSHICHLSMRTWSRTSQPTRSFSKMHVSIPNSNSAFSALSSYSSLSFSPSNLWIEFLRHHCHFDHFGDFYECHTSIHASLLSEYSLLTGTMAQYSSQPFPKPGRNVFTLLSRKFTCESRWGSFSSKSNFVINKAHVWWCVVYCPPLSFCIPMRWER